MGNVDFVYIPIVGRGLQINIICAMHGIEANYLMSKPMGEDFDKDTEAPFGTIPWLKDNSNGIELNDSLAIVQYLVSKYRPNFIFKMLTKIRLQNLDQTSANIVILLIWSKRNKRITSASSETYEHVLATRASTCFLHVRARYLFVRARLLFKNVRPGHLKR